jgi:hypothetical protein
MTFQHHMPGCPHAGEQTQIASGDYFCDCHKFSEPQIGPDGKDVAFPAGWTEMQAQEWRQNNHLAVPSQPGSGP